MQTIINFLISKENSYCEVGGVYNVFGICSEIYRKWQKDNIGNIINSGE